MRFTVKRIKFKRNEVHFIEVKIPKEIRQYKESIFFGLSARQFFCSVIAILIAAGVYLLLGKVIGKESASWLCIVLAAPAAMAGFFSYNGMTFEQFLWAVIKTEYLCYGGRKYISDSAYYKCFNRKGRPSLTAAPPISTSPI